LQENIEFEKNQGIKMQWDIDDKKIAVGGVGFGCWICLGGMVELMKE
jgi:hypothetical protein